MKRTAMPFIAMLLLLPALPGCAGGKKLAPAPAAPTYGAEGRIAVDHVAGVRMRVGGGSWIGGMNIMGTVTPVQVMITNNSGMPLLVRYRDFALIGDTGRRYVALSLFKREGTLDKPELSPGVSPVTHPELSYRRFFVAPHYATAYPGFPTAKWPFDLDPQYYSRYLTDSARGQLPVGAMIRRAIPEGVVDDGGVIAGLLYFEKIEPGDVALSFRAQLLNADSGKVFGTITIPFVVEEK